MSSSLLLIKHTPSSSPTAHPHTVLSLVLRGCHLTHGEGFLSIHVKSVTLHPPPRTPILLEINYMSEAALLNSLTGHFCSQLGRALLYSIHWP